MKVQKRTHKLLIVILVMISFVLGGCRKVKDISVTSVELEAVSPQGFKGLNVYVAVGIDNPALQIGLEDIQGTLKHSGKIIYNVGYDFWWYHDGYHRYTVSFYDHRWFVLCFVDCCSP